MSKLYVMVGIPGSGKSYKARELQQQNPNSIILSSDDIRKEILGDKEDQSNNELIFKTIRERTRQALNKDIDVIFDATNISAKRRISFIKQFPRHEAICVFMYTNIDDCFKYNSKRKRKVPRLVILDMYKKIDVPMLWEGWNKVIFSTNSKSNPINIHLLDEELSFYNYLDILETCGFEDSISLGQDSSYHSLSVDRHMYYAYKKAVELTEDKNLTLAAMFHDVGKPFCKNFKEESKYANFTGHNCVGAYLMIDVLQRLGFLKEDIIDITTLINLHMRIYDIVDNYKAKTRLIDKIGEDMYIRLVTLHSCDIAGH